MQYKINRQTNRHTTDRRTRLAMRRVRTAAQ